MIKSLLTFSLVLFSMSIIGQTGKTVFLKWKLQPKDTLVYKTVMDDIDTLNSVEPTMDIGSQFSKLLGDSADTGGKDKAEDINKFMKAMKNAVQTRDLVTSMAKNKRGIIELATMSFEKKGKDTTSATNDTSMDTPQMQLMMSMLQTEGNSVLLRGAIDENGVIQSFYLKNEQKNLVALFFELPGKPVKTGDSWALDVQLLSMDEHFKCDTSYRKNNVTLVELKKEGTETIAVIKYDIVEYLAGDFSNPFLGSDTQTLMKATYTATAEFSVDKGRWTSYNGLFSLESKGIMTATSVKKFALIAK